MAKNDFQASFHEAFRSMLEMPEVASGTGNLRFVRPDKKTIGTVALRSGKVEALEVTRHPNYILQRAAASAELTAENRDQLLSKFRNVPDSKLVPDYLRQYMMLPDQVITGFVKEHFLGVLDEMMTWSAVRPEWKSGAEDRALTMPFVSPAKLLDLGERRANYLQKIAEQYTVEVDQLDDLKFRQITEVTTDDEDTLNILRLGSGEYGAEGVYRQLGVVPFNVKRELHELWLDEVVDLIYAGQYPLTRPTKEEPETVVDDVESVAADAEAAPELTPGATTTQIKPPPADHVDDTEVDIERWLAQRETSRSEVTVTGETSAVDADLEIAEPVIETDEDETADATPLDEETGEDDDDTLIAAPGADPQPVTAADLPEMELQPFVSPFDDEYHEQLLAEQTSVAETVPAVEPLPVPESILNPQTNNVDTPVDTRGNAVPADATAFLQSINQLKLQTQTSWDEVVLRDEEIKKTRAVIAEQQEYLTQLETDREAWNADFESKRATYEATVALLREHLQ